MAEDRLRSVCFLLCSPSRRVFHLGGGKHELCRVEAEWVFACEVVSLRVALVEGRRCVRKLLVEGASTVGLYYRAAATECSFVSRHNLGGVSARRKDVFSYQQQLVPVHGEILLLFMRGCPPVAAISYTGSYCGFFFAKMFVLYETVP